MIARWAPLLTICVASLSCLSARADVQPLQYRNRNLVLTFEVLGDKLIHFEYSPLASAPRVGIDAIITTPFVKQLKFSGPESFNLSQEGFSTAFAHVQVEPATLCFSVSYLGQPLTRECPTQHGITLDQMRMQNIYGLGEEFQMPGVANGDWMGKIRTPGNSYGNDLPPFGGGYTENAQFPIMYALGPGHLNYALYLDTVYPLRWDFTQPTWDVEKVREGGNPSFAGYFILGDDLPALRTSFMNLVGHPLVPPKKAFGLWVSEFGYRNWGEIDDKLKTLREHHFPVDGFVLDVYWYGGFEKNSPNTPIGTLDWDLKNFPHPKRKIAHYWNDEGIGLMTIEQSYIGENLPNFSSMESRGFLAKAGCATCKAAINDDWWGEGGMIDWTNPAAGAAWNNEHRKPGLTDLGVTFHWTDLGEPQLFNADDYYAGIPGFGHTEADVHNAYNFLWHQSIFNGYEANHEELRHFLLSRSGGPGIQRFGTALWSGDIGSNLKSLAAHLDAQMHMSLSGIDYFGADVGGFHRESLEGNINEVYTKWLAHAALFDVPIRPHTDNGSKKYNTAPDRVGDMKSNLFNLRQRYKLAPYYYSLAYRAYLYGEPVIPPLVYYYQDDPNVRIMADEKMIGPDLLAATAAELGETSRSVYLPAGDWVDFHTLQWFHSRGQWYPGVSLLQNDIFRLPLFARAGSIIPKAHVDDETMNILGKRMDGSKINDLIVEVFASPQPTHFTLYEDDGVTEAYRRSGAYAKTVITQVETPHSETVTIDPTQGTYQGAPGSRIYKAQVVLENKSVWRMLLNGRALRFLSNPSELDQAYEGWTIDARGVLIVKTDRTSVKAKKVFEFDFR